MMKVTYDAMPENAILPRNKRRRRNQTPCLLYELSLSGVPEEQGEGTSKGNDVGGDASGPGTLHDADACAPAMATRERADTRLHQTGAESVSNRDGMGDRSEPAWDGTPLTRNPMGGIPASEKARAIVGGGRRVWLESMEKDGAGYLTKCAAVAGYTAKNAAEFLSVNGGRAVHMTRGYLHGLTSRQVRRELRTDKKWCLVAATIEEVRESLAMMAKGQSVEDT